MNTCRRTLLDKELGKNVPLMTGRVLDIGGVKNNKRGSFRPPLSNVVSWQYANINPDIESDFCCDASEIPVEGNSFDTVVMTELLEYVKEPQKVLDEAFRVLASGGYCLLSTPFMHPAHGDYADDRHRFTQVGLTEMCILTGFELVSIIPIGSLFSTIYDFLYISIGYVRPEPQKLHLKLFRRILNLFKPFCLWVDSFSRNTRKYINTGHFVVLRKS